MAPRFSKIGVHLFYGGEWNKCARGYEYIGGEEEAIWIDMNENYSGLVREIFKTTQWDSTRYALNIKGRYNAARGGRLELKFIPILDDGSYESYLAMILQKFVDSAAVEIFVSRTEVLSSSAPVNQSRTVPLSAQSQHGNPGPIKVDQFVTSPVAPTYTPQFSPLQPNDHLNHLPRFSSPERSAQYGLTPHLSPSRIGSTHVDPLQFARVAISSDTHLAGCRVSVDQELGTKGFGEVVPLLARQLPPREVDISSPPLLKAARGGAGSSILRSAAHLYAMPRKHGPSAADWSSLPDPILMSIAEFITSFHVLAVFASVCRSWRAAAFAATVSHRPPLLLRRTAGKQSWQVHDPAFPSASYKLKFFMLPCYMGFDFLGVSRGCFILGDPYNDHPYDLESITIVNPLTGNTHCSPEFQETLPDTRVVSTLILNTSTVIVLISSEDPYRKKPDNIVTIILRWETKEISRYWTSEHKVYTADLIQRVGTLNDGRIFAAGCRTVFILNLEPEPTLTELVPLPQKESCPYSKSWADNCTHLINVGESLVYLRIVLSEKQFRAKAFCLEQSASGTLEWVKMTSLGDWTVFLSPRAFTPAVACRSPERWGLRSGCIYFAKCRLFEYSSGPDGEWHVADTVDGDVGIRSKFSGLVGRCRKLPQLMVAPHLHSALSAVEKVANMRLYREHDDSYLQYLSDYDMSD